MSTEMTRFSQGPKMNINPKKLTADAIMYEEINVLYLHQCQTSCFPSFLDRDRKKAIEKDEAHR